MRAVKSVISAAGNLKRQQPNTDEVGTDAQFLGLLLMKSLINIFLNYKRLKFTYIL